MTDTMGCNTTSGLALRHRAFTERRHETLNFTELVGLLRLCPRIGQPVVIRQLRRAPGVAGREQITSLKVPVEAVRLNGAPALGACVSRRWWLRGAAR